MNPACARLPLSFDLDALSAEVDALPHDEWVPHFNTGYYTGDWSGAALRSFEGRERWLYPDPTTQTKYADTTLLTHSPALANALKSFHCTLLAVRLLRLGPGSSIKEHTDLDLGIEDGEARIHMPILTNDLTTFWLDGEPVPMRTGEAWYLNLNLPHQVENRGATPRIHLVVDCIVNDWFCEMVAASTSFGARLIASGHLRR